MPQKQDPLLHADLITKNNILEHLRLKEIQKAAAKLQGIVRKTPVIEAPWMSDAIQGKAYLKLENMQITGSFKARGAYIKLSSLTDEEKARGVITMSAGNHAQGVAYHAKKMGISAVVVMPEDTSIAKIEKTRQYGASVILHGTNMTECRDFVMQLIKKHHYVMVHPFDDPHVICGQGTVALEMLEDIPDLDVLLIPVGGGGLAAGMCIAAKAINPKIHIVGVQSAYCSAVAQLLFPNTVPSHQPKHTIAEGIAIKFPGELSLAILREHLDDFLVVDESYIEEAIEALMMQSKVVSEGAGAAGVAALLYGSQLFKGKTVGAIVCGGNVDPRILSNILLKGMVQHGKLIRFKIEINDAPGILGHLTQIIGKAGGNIFEISHQRVFEHVAVKMAFIHAVIETRDATHAEEIRKALIAGGFEAQIIEG
ncbi:MAG: threonine ammonia-lyase [Alphaproteobacteria bacterium]|nr:threonine ammonia-lyase [Alphaproteobacteria bacterium]